MAELSLKVKQLLKKEDRIHKGFDMMGAMGEMEPPSFVEGLEKDLEKVWKELREYGVSRPKDIYSEAGWVEERAQKIADSKGVHLFDVLYG
jgi:hypothetical protein